MNYIRFFIFSLAVMFTAFVSSAPIIKIENVSIQHDLSLEKVKRSIMAAGRNQGWKMHEKSDGEISAELNVRRHQVVVSIAFSNKSYSISYVDSANMNEKNGNIHNNYNKWVKDLNNDIKKYLSQYANSQ